MTFAKNERDTSMVQKIIRYEGAFINSWLEALNKDKWILLTVLKYEEHIAPTYCVIVGLFYYDN